MSTNVAFSNGNVVPGDFQAVNREFSIKQSAHAIHVLSTSLYSRPIEAVIRELSCNALDSHKVAGVTVPFEVSLNSNPNREYTFSVRDFGTGLEPEALERLYTTYFDSTKEQGDGFIGSFGLGSKSPFAYTKKFFINDYYFGIVHKYEAFIDEETHIPVLNKLSEDTSSELANGLEITFEVRYGDMTKFQEAALKVFKFFGDKVVLTGSAWEGLPGLTVIGDYNRDHNKYNVDGQKVLADLPSIMLVSARRYDQERNVLLNHVSYRLDTSKLSFVPKGLENLTFWLKMPAGSLDVTPSREELHYNKKTLTNLHVAMEKATAEIETYKSDMVNKLDNFNLRRQYPDLVETFGSRLFPRTYTRSGVEYCTEDSYPIPDTRVFIKENRYRKDPAIVEREHGTFSYAHLAKCNFVVLNSEEDKPKSRINFLLEGYPAGQKVYVFKNDAHAKEFQDCLFIPDNFFNLVNLNDLPKPPRKSRAKREPGVKSSSALFTWYSTDTWNGTDIDLNDGEDNIYIPLMHWKPFINGEKLTGATSLMHLMTKYRPDCKIYGIKVADVPDVEELDNWTHVEDILTDIHDALLPTVKDLVIVEDDVYHELDLMKTMKLNEIPEFAKVPCFAAYYNAMSQEKSSHETWNKYIAVSKFLPSTITRAECKELQYSTLLKGICEQFPLFGMILKSQHYGTLKAEDLDLAAIKSYLSSKISTF